MIRFDHIKSVPLRTCRVIALFYVNDIKITIQKLFNKILTTLECGLDPLIVLVLLPKLTVTKKK